MTRSWRQRLARRLRRWALALDPPQPQIKLTRVSGFDAEVFDAWNRVDG